MLNGILLGLTRREVVERVDEIIAFSELGQFIDAPLRTYSSGMIARLGFSVAVHLDPDILLVDEVLAVGDEPFRQKCLRRMQQFRERKTTMVFVSHDLPSVAQDQRSRGLDRRRATGRHRRTRRESSTVTVKDDGPHESAADPRRDTSRRALPRCRRTTAADRHRHSSTATTPATAHAKRLNLAVIIPELAKYGGAERYLIECVSRWQKLHDITIYSSIVNADLLAEHGIGRQVKISQLSPYFEGRALDPAQYGPAAEDLGAGDRQARRLPHAPVADALDRSAPDGLVSARAAANLARLALRAAARGRGGHAAARSAHLSQVQLRPRHRRDVRGVPVVDGPGRQARQARPRRGQQPLHGRLSGRRLRQRRCATSSIRASTSTISSFSRRTRTSF